MNYGGRGGEEEEEEEGEEGIYKLVSRARSWRTGNDGWRSRGEKATRG